ncbi:MAG TPA: PTS sugar transporter subunit IIA [Planctomycetota bacterium]|nr:PTS sugar transporter subunit IIA [Planctomycetota bacterium]HUV39211.1 PTS sugar transporter subunit IIA [Planctomycetota bacterium]
MRLLDFFVCEATVDDLKATEKTEVVREMVAALVSAGRIPKRQLKAVVEAVMERERLGSTGIGHGVAIPHTKRAAVKGITGCLGRSKQGVNFAAIDGEPVYLVFLLISPPDEPGSHLKALEQISIVLRDQNFSRFMRRAADREELVSLLREADETLLGN